tara:strand:- start:1682 stop:3364 length:1683 start_codon:yes stop_codon:yes gene_type:complete
MLLKKSKSNKDISLMSLKKMGSRYPSRLSFSRSMLRTMIKEKWILNKVKFDLNDEGYGTAIYEIKIHKSIYSLICFSTYLEDKERSDRVIADKWDTSYTLHIGKISEEEIKRLRKNIPLQESGRSSSKELILSRANKSVRLFKYVVDKLSRGLQPDINQINKVGYLLRTTAVYGSGKFGLSDFERTKIVTHFSQPFRAEMLAVYIIREFSVHLVEHIAYKKNPKKAVKLKREIKQHLGIGNSTGLGMAPFIIKHPKLIHKWINQFEKTVNKIKKIKNIKKDKFKKYIDLLKKSKKYLNEVVSFDETQKNKNFESYNDLNNIINKYKNYNNDINWSKILNYAEKNLSHDAQEIIKVQLIEIYPEIADSLAENMSMSENLELETNILIRDLKFLIEQKYFWAINIDFRKRKNNYLFWYVSEEKLEPRLGERFNEPGANLEDKLGIAKMVSELYQFILKLNKNKLSLNVAEFLILYPKFRGIIKRIQTLSKYKYGEVRDNILAKDVLPIDMLRFKLSFFGASRYDPKSDRWLRVSFFPGAPFYKDLNKKNVDQWGFATTDSYK